MAKRRNLSGIYIFDKLEGDEKKRPTCLEECNEKTRNDWLSSLTKDELISTVNILSKTLKGIGDTFNIVCE